MNSFKNFFEKNFTYLKAFMRNVEHYPFRNALTCPDTKRTWTYEELDAEANRLANALISNGLKKGDVLMASLFNTVEFVFAWIGCQKAGIVFSPINFRLAQGEVALHIDDSAPQVFVFDAELKDVAQNAVQLAEHKPKMLVMTGKGETFAESVSYSQFVEKASGDSSEIPDADCMDEICRLYTSGTTGLPKGVPLTNVNNLMRSYDVLMHFPLSYLDKTMNMTPWFHAGGLHSGGPCPTLHAGGEIIALRAFDPETVLNYVENYRITFLVGVPSTLEMLSVVQTGRPRDLSSLRGIVTMGAPLEKEACLRYQKTLTERIFNGYGTTETFWNTFLRPEDLPGHAGSAGKACTDDEVRVVKLADGRLGEPDELAAADGIEEGEVIIRTFKSPLRYYKKPSEDARHYYKGWYYSSDIATWKDGFVTICGRKDDMLISGGENIHPVQVEEVLNQHPKVLDCMVIGVSDPKWGQVVTAYVVKKDPSLTATELAQFCKGNPQLADFKRPRYIRFVEKLPMTATGKKMHHVAAKMAAGDLSKGELEKI
jgi:acyl-CoA synthetase (AMP-forming)/AMP-acid ligase II